MAAAGLPQTFCRLNESQTAAQFIVTKTLREAPFDAPASVALSDETVTLIFAQTHLSERLSMMTMRESIISTALLPGAVAGLALRYTTSNYSLPVWVLCIVGLGGWLIGFVLAAVVGTIIERLIRRR